LTTQLRWGATSDIGLVREINEDSKLLAPPIFAVADGMGGHSAGDVASGIAVESLTKTGVTEAGALPEAVREANRAIFERASGDETLTGMGTTIIAMFAEDDSAQIVHVGDCRGYLLRGDHLSRLTQDHTVVERLVQEGRILPEDADRHPQRSYLERALGIEPEVEVEVKAIDTAPGDRYMLCSDGLFGMIDDEQILTILRSEQDPQQATDRLCREAVQAGGRDNVTVIVVDYPQGSTASRASAKPSEASASPVAPSGLGTEPGVQAASFDRESPPQVSPRKQVQHRSRRIFVWALAAIIVLGGAAFAAAYSIRNSWYVGASRGRVAIFQGINGSVAGVQLSHPKVVSDLQVKQLPDHYQRSIQEGISADKRSEALATVANLAKLVQPAPALAPTPTPISPPPAALGPSSPADTGEQI